MDSEKVIKRDGEYVLHTYGRNPIVLEKGHGLYAEGPEGQKYLDFTSGIGVNSLGYCDMTWAEAVSEQAHKLQHASNLYYTAPCGKLAKKLCKRTGMSKVFFGNSGAEANEGAIKAARKYSFDKYGADRYNVITLVNSFHGRTTAQKIRYRSSEISALIISFLSAFDIFPMITISPEKCFFLQTNTEKEKVRNPS